MWFILFCFTCLYLFHILTTTAMQTLLRRHWNGKRNVVKHNVRFVRNSMECRRIAIDWILQTHDPTAICIKDTVSTSNVSSSSRDLPAMASTSANRQLTMDALIISWHNKGWEDCVPIPWIFEIARFVKTKN